MGGLHLRASLPVASPQRPVTMPMKPKTPCCWAGCAALTHDRFCEAHAREAQRRYDRERGSSAKRNYGYKWRKTRKRILMRDPVCKWSGCTQPSTEVDHIIPRSRGGTEADHNLQGLCKPHHSEKTAREDNRWG